jgi:Na+/H+ antiporter NhaD/arsenite permease-like protein
LFGFLGNKYANHYNDSLLRLSTAFIGAGMVTKGLSYYLQEYEIDIGETNDQILKAATQIKDHDLLVLGLNWLMLTLIGFAIQNYLSKDKDDDEYKKQE